MSVIKPIVDFMKKERTLDAGIYHRQVIDDAGNSYRLHLRIEPGGASILSINASRILHLNGTATEIAKLIVEGKSKPEAIRAFRKRYRVDKKTAAADYDRLFDIIETLTRTEDVCPISYLDVGRIEPFTTPAAAPYRMDAAITYRCNNGCSHCYVEKKRDIRELDASSWKKILGVLWDVGVYHVAFTGGEATMRDDLPELVGAAEDLGMVSGLLTNGRRLADKKYIGRLIEEGIDYFQITLESYDKSIHNKMVCADAFDETVAGIKNATKSPIHTITNTTITKHNIKTLEKTVDFVASLGVNAFAMNGIIYSGEAKGGEMAVSEDELKAALSRVTEAASRNNLRFIWYTPTQYCRLNPMELDLGIKQCTAGKFNMCVEPNGDVLPCQSYYEPVGNILSDPWEKIWMNPLLVSMRNREYLMEKCEACELLPVCGGGCPLELKNGSYLCTESMSNP